MKTQATPADLSEDERRELERGRHERVATRLSARGRPDLAGWVLEQIWAFDEAYTYYVQAQDRIAALHVALESGRPDTLEGALANFEDSAIEPALRTRAVELLQARGRDLEAARLLAHGNADPRHRAAMLERAGDPFGAAQVLSSGGFSREALDLLSPLLEGERGHADARALAARLSWDLGDAEGAARHAQHALRAGWDSPELRGLLGRALGSLGHDLAAQIVRREAPENDGTGELPARYRVTASLPAPITGAAYVGIDRVTLEEVELHLLLAEHPGDPRDEPELIERIERFALEARLGARIGHPAIRPILLTAPDTGLLVLPRAEGPVLRRLIRPPGLRHSPGRVRALVAFLLEGLLAAAAHGLAHGSLLPSQMVCDALGRPLLGPFGLHHLAGLAATRTGTLEELLRVSAPELRGGAAPTHTGDVFSLGVVMQALLRGNFDPDVDPLLPGPEVELALRMTANDPADRPDAEDVLRELQAPVADTREVALGRVDDSGQGWQMVDPNEPDPALGIAVTPASSWTDEQLDALCEGANPWMQTILDREERRIVLAPWPAGARVLGARDARTDWREFLPVEALASVPEPLKDAIAMRIRPTSLVATPSGEWMLALDDVLSR